MIIQKFGGVAMKDEMMRSYCIKHIKEGIHEFGEVVVVVSAIGRFGTPILRNSLLRVTDAFSSATAASDLVASCGELIAAAVLSAELARAGVKNTILHGVKAGIWTDGDFGDGTISRIDTSSILKVLNKPTVLSFQAFRE